MNIVQIDHEMERRGEMAMHKLDLVRKDIALTEKIIKETHVPKLQGNEDESDKEYIEGMQLAKALKVPCVN